MWRLLLVCIRKHVHCARQSCRRHPVLWASVLCVVTVHSVFFIYHSGFFAAFRVSSFDLSDILPSGILTSDFDTDEQYRGRFEKSSIKIKEFISNQTAAYKVVSAVGYSRRNAENHQPEKIGRHTFSSFNSPPGRIILYGHKLVNTPLLSEVFSLHSQVRYIHQPFDLLSPEGLTDQEKTRFMQNVLACNIAEVKDHAGKGWSMFLNNQDHQHKKGFERVFCFQKIPDLQCPSNVVHLEQLCGLKPNRVMKLTYIKHIRDLAVLLREGIPVIHVVKDPRTVLAELIQKDQKTDDDNHANTQDAHIQDIQLYCNKIERDLDYISKNMLHLHGGKSRYKLLRYEDIELAPVDISKTLFGFLALELSNQDLRALTRKERNFLRTENPENPVWTFLTDSLIQTIQTECARTLDILGYLPMDNLDNGILKGRLCFVAKHDSEFI